MLLHRPQCCQTMTANDKTADGCKEATTVERPADIDGSEAIAETLDVLSNRIGVDLSEITEAIEAGEEISTEEVERVSRDLRRAADTLDRNLLDHETPEDLTLEQRWYDGSPPETDLSETFDPKELIEADPVDLTFHLRADLRNVEHYAQVVEHNILRGSLGDYHVSQLWDSAGRISSWCEKVLCMRVDPEEDNTRISDSSRLSEEQRRRLGLVEETDRDLDPEESDIEEADPEAVVGGALGYE